MMGRTARKLQRKKGRKFGRSSGRFSEGPSPNSVVYRGPSKLSKTDAERMVTQIVIPYQYSGTASGNLLTINTTYSCTDVNSASGWSSFATLWQEFRVLSMRLDYLPKMFGFQPSINSTAGGSSSTTRYVSPIFMAPFHEETTAFASTDAASNHQGSKYAPINCRLSHVNKIKDIDEGDFAKTSTPSGQTAFGLKTWFVATTEGATDTLNFGTIFQTFIVQFRTRVITSTSVDKKSQPSPVPALLDTKDTKESRSDVKAFPAQMPTLSSKPQATPKVGTDDGGVIFNLSPSEDYIRVPKSMLLDSGGKGVVGDKTGNTKTL